MIALWIGLGLVGAVAGSHTFFSWANDLKWEKKMKPCPKCGHRAITIHYTATDTFTAECGAYEERCKGDWHDPNPNECKFCAGYTSGVPQFSTRKAAVEWWNEMVDKHTRGI